MAKFIHHLKDIFNQPPLDIVEGGPDQKNIEVQSKDNFQFPTSFSPKRCKRTELLLLSSNQLLYKKANINN